MASTYASSGSVFDIYCDTTWLSLDYLSLTYTPDFQSCMNDCVAWNTNSTQKCAGVSWISSATGPGQPNGSQCWFYWEMNNTAFHRVGTDSARLRNIQPFPSVFPFSRSVDSIAAVAIS